MVYLAQKWVDLATKTGDGPVTIAIMGSLRIPVISVLFLHQGSGLLLEVLNDLGCARRRGREESAQEVGSTGNFEQHAGRGIFLEFFF